MIEITLPYPISANVYWRTRVIRHIAKTYVSPEAKEFKTKVGLILKLKGISKPIFGRVALQMDLYPSLPMDHAKRMRQNASNWDDTVLCMDLDNAIKVAIDAMKGIAFEDDKFVRSIKAKRHEPDQKGARLEVKIFTIEEMEEEYA